MWPRLLTVYCAVRVLYELCAVLYLYSAVLVLKETGGDGVGRLVEASGVAAMLNSCFALLRLVLLTVGICV